MNQPPKTPIWMTDRIDSKEVKVEYCPTSEMIADFFTKPLPGPLFRKFRDWIMNIAPDPTANSSRDHRSVLGNHENSSPVVTNDTSTTEDTSTIEVWRS